MYYRRAGMAVATFLVCVLSTARADTLEMPAPQDGADAPAQADSTMLELPVRGLSMNQVANRFGTPQKKVGPVGDPPITRWVYAEYTVYFEGKYVIHAVLNRN